MSENRASWILVNISLVIFALYGVLKAGLIGSMVLPLGFTLNGVLTASLGLLACFVTAHFFGIDLGTYGSAFVKLTAITMFTNAMIVILITFLDQFSAGFVAIILYLGMLMFLFKVELVPAVFFSIILRLLSWGTGETTQMIYKYFTE